jgi:GNAT superfamily N-acetyltransferase
LAQLAIPHRCLDLSRIAPFFTGWDSTFVRSCLQGCMGYVLVDALDKPAAAQIVIGDFCLFAGQPDAGLAAQAAAPILVPQNAAWAAVIESVWRRKVQKSLRYAMRTNPGGFPAERLAGYAASLRNGYALVPMDDAVYEMAMGEIWARDFCARFVNADDFRSRGVGVAALLHGELLAGASSYIVYDGGIEIEIATRRDYRRKGLATACGAGLLLECLRRGLQPSWDAQDLRSAALAEKLGYARPQPYAVYTKV